MRFRGVFSLRGRFLMILPLYIYTRTNTGADYFGIWPFISTQFTFMPNQPHRRIPCAKPVLFHNFFFENSKKTVKPLNRYFEFKITVRIIIFFKKNAACPGGAYGVLG